MPEHDPASVQTVHGLPMTAYRFTLLRFKARAQTRLLMRRYRVWSLDGIHG